MTLTEFASLLIEQGKIKRQAKRDPRFAKYPAGTLTELGEIARLFASGPGHELEPRPQPELEGVREMTTHEALEAMSPITGDKAVAELETVEANVPVYDLAHYGFRAPHPAPVVGGLVEIEAEPMDSTEAYIRGLTDELPPAPARDPFVSPAQTGGMAEVGPDPKELEFEDGSSSPATGDVSASPSMSTDSTSKPRESLMTPSIEGGGAYVKALTITPPIPFGGTPPPQPPPFTGNPADYEPGNHYGPGLPASQYPNAPEADPKA